MVLIKVNNNYIPDEITRLISFYRNNPVIAANQLLVRDGIPVSLPPIQQAILHDWWFGKFSITTASRGAGKSFMCALFAALKLMLYPNQRIGVFAPSFRQSKLIFNEFKKFYDDSPLLRECVSKEPTFGNDQCLCVLKPPARGITASFIKALPIGSDGSKIRGERFQCFNNLARFPTNKGIVQVGELVENSFYHDCSVMTPEGYKPISGFIKNPPEEIYEVITEKGFNLEITWDHPLLVKDNNSFVVKSLSELEVGTPIPITIQDILRQDVPYVQSKYCVEELEYSKYGPKKNRVNPILPPVLNESIAEYLGFIVAEGAVNQRSRVELAQKDSELLGYFNKTTLDNFGITGRLDKRVKNLNGKQFIYHRTVIDSLIFRGILKEYGLERVTSESKRVPAAIWKSPRSVIVAFLRGIFEGDGCAFHKSADHKGPEIFFIMYKSKSLELIRDLQLLLSYLGILSYIVTCKTKNKNISQLYELKIYSSHALKFRDTIGFITDRKNDKFDDVKKILFKTKVEDGLFIDKISSIQKKHILESTYDINLDTEDHLFYVNGFVSHNCLLLDEIVHLPESIFRSAIKPMLSTSRNPMQRVQKLKELEQIYGSNIPPEFLSTDNGYIGITSGYYQFNYWWQEILNFYRSIKTGNDLYSLRFVAYTDLPKGFFELDVVRDAEMNDPKHMFLTEWCAEWIADSDGVFPMSLLEGCRSEYVIPKSQRQPEDKNSKFIFGIDIGRKGDATGIIVIEMNVHAKVVYIAELEEVTFQEQAKYIMRLVRKFQPEMIFMDAGGGGLMVQDLLADPKTVGASIDEKIISIDSDRNHKGKRILKMCDFAPAFIEDANNETKLLLEQRAVLLPTANNPIAGFKKGNRNERKEIDLVEEMINQLASITITRTSAKGLAHYDLPNKKSDLPNGAQAVKRKDLYTAFILACKCLYELEFKPKSDSIIVEKGVISELNPQVTDLTQDMAPAMMNHRAIITPSEPVYRKGDIIVPGGGVILTRNGKKNR